MSASLSLEQLQAHASSFLRPLLTSKLHGFAYASAALTAVLLVQRSLSRRRAAAKWRAGKPTSGEKKSTAVVTGGSSGIGLAIVQLFLLRGYNVAILDLTPPPASVAKEAGVQFYKTDVTSVEAVAEAREGIKREMSAVDVVVNNVSNFLPPASDELPN